MTTKNKVKTNEDNTIYIPVSYYKESGLFFEEIYDVYYDKASFMAWDSYTKDTTTREYFERNEGDKKLKYIPIKDDAVRKKAVLLPNNATDYGNTEKLVNEIEEFIQKYVDISDNFRRISAWYILSTWLLDQIGTTSYLRVIGDIGTGKSRFLRVVGGL